MEQLPGFVGAAVAVATFINIYISLIIGLRISQVREDIAKWRGEDKEKLQAWVEERFSRKPDPAILQPSSRAH